MLMNSAIRPVLLLALLLGAEQPSWSGQPRTNDVEDKRKLMLVENAWNQAQLTRDGKALADLVADTYVYTDYDGTVMNKAQFLADSQDQSYQLTTVANEDVNVFLYDNSAVVIGAYHTKGVYKGNRFDHHGRFTDTWVFQNSRWQCVATHTNLILGTKVK